MRSLATLGIFLVIGCLLDTTDSALFYYHRPRPIEPVTIGPTKTHQIAATQREGRRYDLLPFLKAVKASNQVDWEEWKEWLFDIGLLQPIRPKLKDIRL